MSSPDHLSPARRQAAIKALMEVDIDLADAVASELRRARDGDPVTELLAKAIDGLTAQVAALAKTQSDDVRSLKATAFATLGLVAVLAIGVAGGAIGLTIQASGVSVQPSAIHLQGRDLDFEGGADADADADVDNDDVTEVWDTALILPR